MNGNTNRREDIGDVKKLMCWVIGILVTIFLFVGGGTYGVLNNANAKQDQIISQKAGTDLMIQYEIVNQREHLEIKNSVNEIKKDVSDVKADVSGINVNLNNIKDDIGEIKELLRK